MVNFESKGREVGKVFYETLGIVSNYSQGIYGYELYKNNNHTDLKKLVEKLIEIVKGHRP